MIVTQNIKQWEQTVARLIALAWFDQEFHLRLVNNTVEVLWEAGVAIEDFAKVIVNQSPTEAPGLRMVAAGEYEICLPPQPSDIASEQLFSDNYESLDSRFSFRFCCGLCSCS